MANMSMVTVQTFELLYSKFTNYTSLGLICLYCLLENRFILHGRLHTSPFTLLCAHTGFFRVNYDHTNWRLLISSFQKLPDVTRAQLLDDALNLALSGRLEYSIALDLTSQLITDVEYLPWSAALTALEHLDTMLALTPAYGNFKVCDMGACTYVSVPVKMCPFC
jgi:hypothetical protein